MRLETGSRGGIGERDVWQAADALLLAGARPTVERVRAQIGRGSPNTVAPLLDGWFKALGGRIQNPAAFQAEAAAPSVPEPVLDAARQFWEAALVAARREIEASLQSEREDLARIRADFDRRSAEFATERARFDADVRAQQALIENYEHQLRDARAAVELADAERAALIASQERLQSQHEQERTAFAEELAAARSELLALREEIAALRDAADRDMKDALLKLDRARTEAVTAQKSLTDVRERLVRSATELDAAGKQVAQLERERAALQTDFGIARDDLKATLADLERHRTSARTLQSALDSERERNREMLELLAACQGQVAEGLRVIHRLKLAGRSPKLRRSTRLAV